MKPLFGLMMALGCATSILSQELAKPIAEQEGSSPLMVSFADLKWIEQPDVRGAEFAVLSGDPKTGPYTQMRRIREGTDNPLHRHTSQLKHVIIQGLFYIGVDPATAKDFGPGSVIVLPANWVHVSGCRPGVDCVFYQEGKGKFDYHPVTAVTVR